MPAATRSERISLATLRFTKAIYLVTCALLVVAVLDLGHGLGLRHRLPLDRMPGPRHGDEAPPTAGGGTDEDRGVEYVRVAGTDRWHTGQLLARQRHGLGAEGTVVVNGTRLTDGIVAALAAADFDWPLLATAGNVLPELTAAELRQSHSEKVILVGGTAAITRPMGARIAAESGADVYRIGGPDRAATAVELNRMRFPDTRLPVEVAFVTTGESPDALAVAAAAAATGAPLLLTEKDRLPDAIADELARVEPDRIVLHGVTAARVAQELARYAATVDRIADADPYTAAARLATSTFRGPVPELVVATGEALPDALAGSSLGVPMLLVPPDRPVPGVVAGALAALQPSRLILVGGTAALPESVARDLHAIAEAARY